MDEATIRMEYHQMARTNYFAVKDVEAFRTFIASFKRHQIRIVERTAGQKSVGGVNKNLPVFALFFTAAGVPDSDPRLDEPIDFLYMLSQHLQPGWVVELQTIGWEGGNYYRAQVGLVNSEGVLRKFEFEEIRKLGMLMGPYYSRCEF